MRFRPSAVILEILTVAMLAISAGLLYAPVRDSRALMQSESAALDVLEALGDAQRRLIASRADQTPGFLPEIQDLLPNDLREEMTRTNFLDQRKADGHFIVGRARGYCFVVYLIDAAGNALVESGGQRPKADFWLIYAWPERYGKSGRRIFVLDSAGHYRLWENPLGHYSGADMPPAAGLVRSATDEGYPLRDRVSGWEKTIRWDPVLRDAEKAR